MRNDTVEIRNPANGFPSNIQVERIPVGLPYDYKPNLAILPDGELLLTAFRSNCFWVRKGVRENILLFRSADGGRTWSDPDILGVSRNLPGREPYLTVLNSGVIFLTCSFLKDEERNFRKYPTNFIHRSADKGKTWTTMEVTSPRTPEGTRFETTRNILELPDGTLLFIITSCNPLGDFILKSTDSGVTWHDAGEITIENVPESHPYGVFAEAQMLQLTSGRMLLIARVDHRCYPMPERVLSEEEMIVVNQLLATCNVAPIASIAESGYDEFEHMIFFTSDDGGTIWKQGANIGDYGMMYPSVLRLGGGRVLFTFTVRHINPPLGVRAVLGSETPAGLQIDFGHNMFMLDTATPFEQSQGGGFGNTVRLPGGGLATAYSYRDENGDIHMEIVRWNLPG